MPGVNTLIESTGNTKLYAYLTKELGVRDITGQSQDHLSFNGTSFDPITVNINGKNVFLDLLPYTAPMVPRAAEVIGNTLYVIAGSYSLPLSPSVTAEYLKLGLLDEPGWNILSYDLKGEFNGYYKSPTGQNYFTNSELSSSEVARQVISGMIAVPANSTTSAGTSVDSLTGISHKKDIFSFTISPVFGGNLDKITNFSTKDKDTLRFSKLAFGVTNGKFAIAKKQKDLSKILATDTNFVYNQQNGELIFNANGPDAGFGVDGGAFAQLLGAPKLTASSVSFI